MSCAWMLQSGDGCVLALTLCKYDLRKGDLLVLSWAKGATSEAGNVSLQSCKCVVEVCAVFCYCLLWLDGLETIDVCIWCMFVFMSIVVTV